MFFSIQEIHLEEALAFRKNHRKAAATGDIRAATYLSQGPHGASKSDSALVRRSYEQLWLQN